MYRGSHPTSGADQRPSPPPAAMLAVDMNRLPSIPSRPAPPQPFTAYSPYQRYDVTPSRPDMFPPSQYHRPRDNGAQSNAQQLPSLRTLLEPELLDTKLSDPPPRSGGAHLARYGSSSPTLKRRHDFESYSHEHPDHNAIAARAPHVQRHAHSGVAAEVQQLSYSTPGSTPSSRQLESSRPGSLVRPHHNDVAGNMYRPPSTASEPAGSYAGQIAHDDPMDIAKPIRRRTEGTSRAPVRASRCVGQREIPGEGLCYVYEDGTYCRAIIDGEPVNPSWGITKAGKPRKRLAQACLTCREKKIKCEPGYPKCHQCAKSQRVCKGGLNQLLGMSNASGETSPSSSTVLFKNPSTELVSPVAGHKNTPRAIDEQRDPSRTVDAWNATAGSPFRHRNFRPTSVATSRDMSVHSADSDWSSSLNPDLDDTRRGSHQDQLALQWEQDPYETDARLTMHLLDLYFLHAGRATYGMFPRKPFLAWVETNHEKSQDYLMLLYAVLALGSVFSNDSEHKVLGKRFAAISAYATEKRFGKFTLQLCQSRLVLALYNFARGRAQEAWDFCGAGLRALSALKLNTEEGVRELPEASGEPDYGFDNRTLEECCRRTFWSGFLMDRYNGFCGGTLCVINIEDTFIHLPCMENLYEASNPCETPSFDFELLNPQAAPGPPLGHMAYLILISVIWGEVLTFTSRAVHRPDAGYEQVYETFYAKTYERLNTLRNMLPSSLQFNPQNFDNAISEGHAGTFISLHALYHVILIRLNRHVRLHVLPSINVARNTEESFRNAANFLSMIVSLTAVNRQGRLPPNSVSKFLFSTPFPGYALMLSVDVISSAGTLPGLPVLVESIGSTLTCIEELAEFWASARVQQKAISARLKQLADMALQDQQGVHNGSYGQLWRLPDSLEVAFGADDAVYKASDQLLFDVVTKRTGW